MRLLFFFWMIGLIISSLTAQTMREKSAAIKINYGYPELVISKELSFNDQNNNKSIDPGETVTIGFFIDNKGLYPAKNVTIKTRDMNQTVGLILEEEKFIGNIPRDQRNFFIQSVIRGDSTLEAGKAYLVFDVYEKGEQVETLEFRIATTGLVEGRNLEVISSQFFADKNNLHPGKPFTLKLSVKNKGTVPIKNVSFNFLGIQHLLEQFKRQDKVIKEMQPGDIETLTFQFFLGINYKASSLPVKVVVQGSNEKEGTLKTLSSSVIQQ